MVTEQRQEPVALDRPNHGHGHQAAIEPSRRLLIDRPVPEVVLTFNARETQSGVRGRLDDSFRRPATHAVDPLLKYGRLKSRHPQQGDRVPIMFMSILEDCGYYVPRTAA